MVSEMFTLAKKNIGNYIRFAGAYGLERKKTKISFYKILGVNNKFQVFVKQYRKKGFTIVEQYCQCQEFEILDKNEFKKLPVW